MAMTRLFKPFSNLFPEIRQCIVDEMEPADRVRFTRCSKRSSEEAKRSKNYIYGLSIHTSPFQTIIQVEHGEKKDRLEVGYIMRFEHERPLKICSNSKHDELWREVLDGSTELAQNAAEHFKQLLKMYQRKVKKLDFEGEFLKDYDLEINSLKSLQRLAIDSSMNIAQFCSKLQNPLKSLCILGKRGESVADCEHIYEVSGFLLMTGKKFSYEQMLRLSARYTGINIGNLTEKNICALIRSWQNGTIRSNVVCYDWRLRSSNFDVLEVLRLLGKPIDDMSRIGYEIEIEHNIEKGKKATLKWVGCNQGQFIFDTRQPRRT